MSTPRDRSVKPQIPFTLAEATNVLYNLFEVRKQDIYGIFKTSIKQQYTESLALAMLPSILSDQYEYRKGGRIADIIADSGHEEFKIEIKTTLEAGFTCLGPKDITADYLIWIDFNDFFTSRDNTYIDIYIGQDIIPRFECLSDKEKTNLRCTKIEKFIKIMGEDLTTVNFNLKEFIFK